MKTTKEIMSTISTSQLLDDSNSALLNGRYYDAMHLLNAYLLFDHTNILARLRKGLCYLYTNQPDKARFLFDQVLSEGEDQAEAYYCYAEYYKLHFDYELANTYISAAISADNENATYHWLASEICFLKSDLDASFTLINRAIVLNPFKEELYYWRAMILNRFGKETVAIGDLTRAICINPSFSDALRLRAKIRMNMGVVEEALKDLKQAQRFELLKQEELKRAA